MATGISPLYAQMAGAQPCPHPRVLVRAKILVSDGEASMVLCPTCYRALRGLVTRAESGDRPALADTTAQLVALGYTPEDAIRFWEDLPHG